MTASEDTEVSNPEFETWEVQIEDAGDVEGFDGVYVHSARRPGDEEWREVDELPQRVRLVLVGYREGCYLMVGYDSWAELRSLTRSGGYQRGIALPGTLRQVEKEWVVTVEVAKRRRSKTGQR